MSKDDKRFWALTGGLLISNLLLMALLVALPVLLPAMSGLNH